MTKQVKVTKKREADVERKQEEIKPSALQAVINSDCKPHNLTKPLRQRLRRKQNVRVCPFQCRDCLFIDSKQRFVVRLVHASSLDSRTKREAVGPSTRSAPSLIPSNIYAHTLLEWLKYNQISLCVSVCALLVCSRGVRGNQCLKNSE